MRNRFKTSEGAQTPTPWRGELRVLQRLSEYEFGVELRIMRDGVNNNKWDYQNIDRYYQTFAGTPILIAYVGNQVGDGHNSGMAIDPKTGQQYRSYMGPTAERIVGTISDDPKDLSLRKEADGHTWIVAKGRLWRVYAPELVEKIVRTGRMEVSAETNVRDAYFNGDIEVFPAWEGLGVTILGEHVPPAIPGANIQALAALESEFKTMKLRVASLLNPAATGGKPQEKNTEKGVKTHMFENKTIATELAKKFPDYRVMAFSEDGMNVCLMNKETRETFAYTFEESDKGTVIPERIRPVVLSADVKFGDDTLHVAVDHIIDEMGANMAELTRKLSDESSRATALEEQLEGMKARETARRVKASKEAAIGQLQAINANRAEDEKIAEDSIQSILEAAERGDYATCTDDAGEWVGDSRIQSAVRDVAMQAQMELDKNRADAARQAKNKRYAFESGYNGSQENDDSLEGLYARITG